MAPSDDHERKVVLCRGERVSARSNARSNMSKKAIEKGYFATRAFD